MQFLVICRRVADRDLNAFARLIAEEGAVLRKLQVDGVLTEAWSPGGPGAVLMLELPDQGTTFPSGLWTRDEVIHALAERQNRFLKASLMLVGIVGIGLVLPPPASSVPPSTPRPVAGDQLQPVATSLGIAAATDPSANASAAGMPSSRTP